MNKYVLFFTFLVLLVSCSNAQKKNEFIAKEKIENGLKKSDKNNWLIDLYQDSLLYHPDHTIQIIEFKLINDRISYAIISVNNGVCNTSYIATQYNRTKKTIEQLAQNCDYDQSTPTYNWSEYQKKNDSVYIRKDKYRTTYTSKENLEYSIDEEMQYQYKISSHGEIIKTKSNTSGLNLDSTNSYTSTKNSMNQIITNLNNLYMKFDNETEKHIVLDSTKVIFTNQLLNQIIPHWYGTTWDFDGHTSVPKQGTIACGYFVSTTLLHMGININRYKQAQQNPKNEALTFAIKKSNLIYLSNGDQVYTTLHALDNGLYFVGLDSHVGYLYINNNNSFFIHSNYIDGKVMLEHTRQSEAFISSEYYITPITQNKELMHYWLTKKKLNIITE